MSVTASPPPPAASAGGVADAQGPVPARETCPLCGAPLDREQEWCLRCGAAARTRLAASSNWKAPIIAFAVIALLSLGVLAAALVKLAGDSPSTVVTRTVISTPAAAVPPTTTPPPPASTPATPPTAGAATPPAGATGQVKNPSPTTSSPAAPLARSPARTRRLIELETTGKNSNSPAVKKRLAELETRLREGK